jgi:hypothetical protein
MATVGVRGENEMIAWAIVVALLTVGIVVLPKRRERVLFAVLLGLIALIAVPPLLVAYRKHDHAAFVVFHLRPTKQLLSLIRTDVEAGRTNAALGKIDTALSDWDELQTRGTNRTVSMIVERIEKGSESGPRD